MIGNVDISGGISPTLATVENRNLAGTSSTDSITLSGTQLDALLGGITNTIDLGGNSDAIVLTSTSTVMNGLSDAVLRNVETISTAPATAGVAIDLHTQSDGFMITGSRYADIITGSRSNDTIDGFVGADTVDGGNSLDDNIILSATSTDLNNATDSQIVRVEGVNAGAASAGVTIDLRNQSDPSGFKIIGSAHADTITGSSGSDTIYGFVGADMVDGGGGINEISLLATSADFNNEQMPRSLMSKKCPRRWPRRA